MSDNQQNRRDGVMNSINEIDMHQLLSEIVTHKWLIIIVTVVFFVLGAAVAIHKKPRYQTSALIQMK